MQENRPLPKFCVGEEVMIRSQYAPEYNTDRTEVVSAIYREAPGINTGHIGWWYKTAHQPDKRKSWVESSLRKLPPDEIKGWESCAWQPEDVVA